MDATALRIDLEASRQCAGEARSRLQRQERRVSALKAASRPYERAATLLAAFQDSYTQMAARRDYLARNYARSVLRAGSMGGPFIGVPAAVPPAIDEEPPEDETAG